MQIIKDELREKAKSHQQYVFFALAIIALLLFEIILYFSAVAPKAEDSRIADMKRSYVDNGYKAQVLSDGVIYEQLVHSEKPLAGISVCLGTYGNESPEGSLVVEVYDATTKALFEQTAVSLESAVDNRYFNVPFQGSYKATNGQYLVKIWANVPKGEDVCAIWTTRLTDDFFAKQATCDGKSVKAYLNILPLYVNDTMVGFYFAIACGSLLLLVEAFFLIKKIQKVHYIFAFCMIFLGFLYMLVYPPYTVFDESTHILSTFARATAWSEGSWDVTQNSPAEIRQEEVREGFVAAKPSDYQYYYLTETIFDQEKTDEYIDLRLGKLPGLPYEYVAPIVGTWIARAFHMGQTATLYTAQFTALLFYTAICTWAISLSPYPTLFAIIAMFPSPLRSGASFSYDSFINAIAFLFIAYVLNLIYKARRVKLKDVIIASLLFCLLAPCKVIYIPMGLLLLLIPKEKFARKNEKMIWIISTYLVAALAVFLLLGGVLERFVNVGSTESVTPWGQTGYTVESLLSQPFEFVRITIVSFLDQAMTNIFSAVSGVQFIAIPDTINVAFLLIALLAVGEYKQNKTVFIRKRVNWAGILVAFLVTGLGYAASLSWTYVGSYYYQGMQGRYLVPILPLILLFFGDFLGKTLNRKILFFGAIYLNVYCVLKIFMNAIW